MSKAQGRGWRLGVGARSQPQHTRLALSQIKTGLFHVEIQKQQSPGIMRITIIKSKL